MLCAEAHGNRREDQHGIVGDLPVQGLPDPPGHGLGNDLVSTQGTLLSMLLQGPDGDQYHGLLFIHSFHFKPRQLSVIPYHRIIPSPRMSAVPVQARPHGGSR